MTTCLLVWKLAQWRLGSSMTLLKMTELMHIQEGRRVGNFLEPGCEAADRQECFSCGFPFFFFSGAVLEQVSIGHIWSGFYRLILKPRMSNTPLFSLPF